MKNAAFTIEIFLRSIIGPLTLYNQHNMIKLHNITTEELTKNWFIRLTSQLIQVLLLLSQYCTITLQSLKFIIYNVRVCRTFGGNLRVYNHNNVNCSTACVIRNKVQLISYFGLLNRTCFSVLTSNIKLSIKFIGT